ncbi:hypothetical protein [Paenibacillus roseipurpureus]|uniref:Uncharacterized protein n=1 Tax=Paenibacillus roseopurpureus TaxID=2918901 RepID=A0AA96RJG0_9BACL|nr:hypothetical protein [Paenibacillus sp. MBLB1832]WNR43745.1 hypothetical protein MJB10_21980 [Paenibacillus sp. MBLB1832]
MWFQKKKSSPLPSRSSPSAPAAAKNDTSLAAAHEQTVRLLEQRLRKLEEQLSSLTTKHPNIHIDHLHVHQPVLENLTFRLDQLDIKELSGSLNLGNNFGAKPNTGGIGEGGTKPFQHVPDKRQPEAKPPETKQNDAAAGPERTSTGYRYSPPQSKE